MQFSQCGFSLTWLALNWVEDMCLDHTKKVVLPGGSWALGSSSDHCLPASPAGPLYWTQDNKTYAFQPKQSPLCPLYSALLLEKEPYCLSKLWRLTRAVGQWGEPVLGVCRASLREPGRWSGGGGWWSHHGVNILSTCTLRNSYSGWALWHTCLSSQPRQELRQVGHKFRPAWAT